MTQPSSKTSTQVPKPARSTTAANAQALTKDRIVDVSIALIDRIGIEKFSMRNVAKELGVYPTAIYWHIPSRNDLLGEVVAKVLKDIAPALDDDCWQDWLRRLFNDYRKRIREHPNIATLIGGQLVSNSGIDFDLVERVLVILKKAGFVDHNIVAAFSVVITGVFGFTTQEFSLIPSDDASEWQMSMRKAIESTDAQTHPRTAQYAPMLANKTYILRWQNGARAPLDDGFKMFVETIISGLEQQVTKRPS